jgi:hypothetical protein
MPMPERARPICSSVRFFDLLPELRGMVLAYFADAPPYPFLRANKPHDIDVFNFDRGTTVSFRPVLSCNPTSHGIPPVIFDGLTGSWRMQLNDLSKRILRNVFAVLLDSIFHAANLPSVVRKTRSLRSSA